MFGMGRGTRRGPDVSRPQADRDVEADDDGDGDGDSSGLAAMMTAGGNARMAEVGGMARGAGERIRGAGHTIAGAARHAKDAVVGAAGDAKDTITGTAGDAKDAITGAAGAVKGRAKGAVKGWKRKRADKKQAKADRQSERAAFDAEVAKLGFDSDWGVHGKDDLGTLKYLKDKACTPTSVPGFWTSAMGTASAYVGIDPDYEHMTQQEVAGVIVYSGQASYGMNALLRGQLASKNWVKHLRPMIAATTAGLAKLPDGARNYQGTKSEMKFAAALDQPLDQDKMVDKKQDPKAILSVPEVYRADGWNPAFSTYFRDEIAKGRTIQEPAFLSTTIVRGSYGGAPPVTRIIKDPKGKSIVDLSLVGSEKELLMAPGQRFVIDKVTLKGSTKDSGEVANPGAKFPQVDASATAVNEAGKEWEVECTHVGGPEASKATKKKAGEDGGEKKDVKKRSKRLPRLQKKKLGEG